MELDKHPISQIVSLIQSKEDELLDARFEFCYYQYSYISNIELKKTFTVVGRNLNLTWFQSQLATMPFDWEMGIHSKIKIKNKKIFHLPLIDFNISSINEKVVEIIKNRFEKQKSLVKYRGILENMNIYNSGRSYHGYSNSVLSEKDWREFTTAILLLNYTKGTDETMTIIDTRWVAHRLLEGYGSLRLTCNTKNYLNLPILIDNLRIM